MRDNRIVEPIGFVIAGAAFIFSFLLFYSDNGMFFGSFSAALMTAALAWGTYIVLRWILLAIRE